MRMNKLTPPQTVTANEATINSEPRPHMKPCNTRERVQREI